MRSPFVLGRFLTADRNWHLYFFTACSCLLLLVLLCDYRHLLRPEYSSILTTYTQNFLHGNIGSGYGEPHPLALDLDDLEAGDIILGGYPNCAYGKYSHAGLYLGNGQVVEGFVDVGVSIQELSHYIDYTYLMVLRVESPDYVRLAAIQYAKDQVGKAFYPLAFKKGERYWNCTKLIWRAYGDQGFNLDPVNDLWMAPDCFAKSPLVRVIYEKV